MNLFKTLSAIFEKEHQKYLKEFLMHLDIEFFIDAGAYEGNFLRNFNTSNIKYVYMFEPNINKYQQLKEKNKDFFIFNYALSNKKGMENFLINETDDTTSTLESVIDTNSVLYFVKTNILNASYKNKIQVETEKLDNIFDNEIYRKSFLKIDTEGSDYEVLKGGEELLSKIDYVLVEVKKLNFYRNCKKNDIYELLFEKKFRIKKIFSSFPHFYQDSLFEKEI